MNSSKLNYVKNLISKSIDIFKSIFGEKNKEISLFLLITMVMPFLSFTAYVQYCSLRNKDVRFFRNNSIVKRIYTDRDFIELYKKISKIEERKKSKENLFETIDDFDDQVYLEKDMFVETDMYGEKKYKYKPNLKIMDITVWTGLSVATFSFHVDSEMELDQEIEKLLKRVKVIHKSITIETDRFGFKKTDFPNSEGSRAIIFLGDSFTEGLFSPPSKTFSNVFGIVMQENGFQAIPVNMGVNGYSALEMMWMLETYSKYFDVKMVIANLFPNDVHADYIKVITGEDDKEEGYKDMFFYLKKMKDFCVANNIKLVISAIPAKEQLSKIPVDGLFQMRVSKWCNAEKVIFLNPLEYFRAIGERKIYLSWDPHFSDSGHKYYALFLFDNLQKEIKKIMD